jgi:hypothetical protein
MKLGMSEQNPRTPNYEIANLSAEEKWLKADRWCSDLLKRANELDKLTRAGQDDNDKNTVFETLCRYTLYEGLFVREFRLAPRKDGNYFFDVDEVLVIFPVDERLQDDYNDWRLIFLQVKSTAGDKKDYMVTHNNFVDLAEALANEPPITKDTPEAETFWGRTVEQLNKEPIGNMSQSDEHLYILRSLQYLFCDQPKYDYGIRALPNIPKKDR